jgi:hypothetical protein
VEKAEERAQRKREGDKDKNWQDVLIETVEVNIYDDDDVYLYKLQKRILIFCTICFHIDQPERHKYKKISIMIRIND